MIMALEVICLPGNKLYEWFSYTFTKESKIWDRKIVSRVRGEGGTTCGKGEGSPRKSSAWLSLGCSGQADQEILKLLEEAKVWLRGHISTLNTELDE